jgi:uncharacterized membrane protein YeiH
VVRPITRVQLLTAVDLAATLVFAFEGAQLAANARLDVFGILVIAFVSSLAGGITRDMLIGDVPPASLRLVSYPLTALAGGTLVVVVAGVGGGLSRGVLDVLDALGLSLFAVAGAATALDRRLHPVVAVMLGALTAVGGGTLRDVLLNVVPAVLRADVYATAAVFGAAILVVASLVGMRRGPAMLIGGAACCLLRLAALRWSWNLPTVD